MDKPVAVSVEILGKKYRIACEEGEEKALVSSASYLDGKMQEIKETGKVVGSEQVAVMAALNISHELLQQKQQKNVDHEQNKMIKNRLSSLQEKMDLVLADNHQSLRSEN